MMGATMTRRKTPLGLRIFVALVISCVVLAVGYGIYLVGSPGQQRQLRLDERRVADLQNISSVVQFYWEENDQLPAILEDLQSDRYFVESIRDPETGELYEYNVTGDSRYQLCAVFAAPSPQEHQGFPPSVSTWAHDAGRACFDEDAIPPEGAFPKPLP